MTHGATQRFLSCVLIFCILAVGGLAAAQSIAHESQHSHHQKATHSSVLCSWMCAAGQIHEASFDAFDHQLTGQDFVAPVDYGSCQENVPSLFPSRAPPQPLA